MRGLKNLGGAGEVPCLAVLKNQHLLFHMFTSEDRERSDYSFACFRRDLLPTVLNVQKNGIRPASVITSKPKLSDDNTVVDRSVLCGEQKRRSPESMNRHFIRILQKRGTLQKIRIALPVAPPAPPADSVGWLGTLGWSGERPRAS